MASITITLDDTDHATLAASVARLDDGFRTRLARALHEVSSADNEARILRTVREVLAREYPGRPAVGVLFTVNETEYDDGYFLTSEGLVLFTKGSVETVTFDYINETFNEEYGRAHQDFTLAVDLRTGRLNTWDHKPLSIQAHFDRVPTGR